MGMKTVSLDRVIEYVCELKGDVIKHNEWRRPLVIDAIRWQIDQLSDEDAVEARKLVKDLPEFGG